MATTFEQTWQQLVNKKMSTVSAAEADKNYIFFLKHFLTGQYSEQTGWTGKWSVYYSCDGTTAGTAGDNVDRWGSSFNAAKIVQATAGSAHSWMVLYKTIGSYTWYIILDCDRASTPFIDFVFCKTAPTGGSTTARPTSTDEFGHTNLQMSMNTAGQYAHGLLTTDGSCFVIMPSVQGTGLKYPWMVQAHAEAKTEDLYPLVSWLGTTNGFRRYELQYNGSCWAARKFDGSTTLTIGAGAPCGLTTWLMEYIVADGLSGKFPDFPMYLFGAVAGSYTKKGRLYDIRWAPLNLTDGFIEPSPATGVSSKYGCVWLPFSSPIVL